MFVMMIMMNPLVINILCVTYFSDVINNARPAK